MNSNPNCQEFKCVNCYDISEFVEYHSYLQAHLCPQCEWKLNEEMNYDGEG